ncbi:hypothetical protein [Sphingobacterium siyangense]|uniref:hypothetical protein n=1 Tax=Sphingobacterium siyangense TaxID=459529 RepID=UPI0028AC5EAA|nr:hypothetical protein [Sphingobacterium siyangense]
MKKNKLMRGNSRADGVNIETLINDCEQKLKDELSYASVGLGMTQKEFKKREIIPFISLYIFIFTLLNITSWGPFPFLWQLVIISLSSIFAYYSFSHLFRVRKEREDQWSREQGYKKGYDHGRLRKKREQAIIHLLKQMDCCSIHLLHTANERLNNDLEKWIVKDYPSHLRGGFIALLINVFQEIYQSPMSVNSLFTPKILKSILSYLTVVGIYNIIFFIKKYLSLSYRRKKDLQNILMSIQHKLGNKKKNKK